MHRLSRVLVLGSVLTVGVVIGAAWDSWRLTPPVAANGLALSREESDRLYQELGAVDGALTDSSRQIAKIARLTTPSVVHIQSTHRVAGRGQVEETGSGVLMTSDSVEGVFVVTNRHVVASANRDDVTIHLFDGRVLRPDQVWTDQATDLAVMKVGGASLSPARWGDSDQLEIGHMVLAMGSPFGLSQSVTMGIISAKGRRALKLGTDSAVLNQDFLQTDAAINPGNSGGPLIDMHGRIIGINTAIASNSGGNDGIGFSIPSNLARSVAEQLIKHGKVQRAYLGVKLDPKFDAAAARRFRLDRPRGAHVLEVYPNTPASEANIQYDDILLTFDGIDVQDENHLINLVSLRPVGSRVRVIVLRGGRQITLTVLLSDRMELDQQSQAPALRPGTGTQVRPMGLILQQVDRSIASQIGLEATAEGLLVLSIDPKSPLADQVQLYDLIEDVARQPVHSVESLERVLHDKRNERAIPMTIRRRNGQTLTSHVVIWRR